MHGVKKDATATERVDCRERTIRTVASGS